MSIVCAAESPLFDFASANCLSKRFVDQEHASALEELLPGPGHRCVGCSVASSARRGVRQQIRSQLSTRGRWLFLFVAKLTGQVAPAKEQMRRTVHPPICSLALTKRLEVDNFDGSALSFGSNDVGHSPAALFIAALRRSRTPKMYATRPQNKLKS